MPPVSSSLAFQLPKLHMLKYRALSQNGEPSQFRPLCSMPNRRWKIYIWCSFSSRFFEAVLIVTDRSLLLLASFCFTLSKIKISYFHAMTSRSRPYDSYSSNTCCRKEDAMFFVRLHCLIHIQRSLWTRIHSRTLVWFATIEDYYDLYDGGSRNRCRWKLFYLYYVTGDYDWQRCSCSVKIVFVYLSLSAGWCHVWCLLM